MHYECNFCILNFDCRSDRNAHIKNHFKQKYCAACGKTLIEIGDIWYEFRIHIDDGCGYGKELKAERDYGTQLFQPHLTDADARNKVSEEQTSVDYYEQYMSPVVTMSEDVEAVQAEIKIEIEEFPAVDEIETNAETDTGHPVVTETTARKTGKPEKPDSNAKVECEICGKLLTKTSLKTHKKVIHENQKLFTCEMCGKSFSNKTLLKAHMNVHMGVFDFICPYCGRGFNTKSNFNIHLNSHTDNRPFVCSICGKAYKQDSPYRQHMLAHNNIKPYKCRGEGCDKMYSHFTDLKRHEFKYHGIYQKEIFCPVCSKQFGENKSLRSHLKSHKKVSGED